MKTWIPLLASAALLGCLPRPSANNSKPQTTLEVCYKDFFSTLEGKKLSEAMRAANEERSGLSMSDFGLNQIRNYLEPLYHTKASDRGLGILRPRWAMFDVFSLYGYAPPWVKWGLPDTLKVTAKKMEKVYDHIQILKKTQSPRNVRNAEGKILDVWEHTSQLEIRLEGIIRKRSQIVALTQNNPKALSISSTSRTIQNLNADIDDEFIRIEFEISGTKKYFPEFWTRVQKFHLEHEADLARNSQELLGRLDADEEFLIAVSRFITSPAETLIRGTNLKPISTIKPPERIIRGADGSQIEFRSYVYVEGTREPVFNALHERGINMVVFLDGAEGVERQMIFMSNDSGLANTANKAASSLNLSPQELSFVQKWRPDATMLADPVFNKRLTVLKLDEVAPDRFGPLARGIKEGDECPICISDLPIAGDASSSGGISFCPNCCKGFHLQCMIGWAQSKPKFSCPMCRGEVTLDTLMKK